ncbi:MAG TPA: zf-HC2 domain-containing protein [Candidatus Polarisedimenticolaceae bacterium]
MACELFQSRLVALVYDDVSAEDRACVQAHLAGCASCSATLERLAATRALLADAAPEVPVAPRIVVVTPRRTVPSWAAFAAGLLAAALVGGVGYVAGSAGRPDEVAQGATPPAGIDAEQARALVRQEIEALEASSRKSLVPDAVTRDVLRTELAGLERRINSGRADDVGYVLDQIAASETRSRQRIGDTQQALRYVALANNPGLGEY